MEIRPVSDLRNKFPEIEELVLREEKEVYLTKNGYGSMVVMSLEAYSQLTEGVEHALDEADRLAELDSKRLSHEEVFDNLKRRINACTKI